MTEWMAGRGVYEYIHPHWASQVVMENSPATQQILFAISGSAWSADAFLDKFHHVNSMFLSYEDIVAY